MKNIKFKLNENKAYIILISLIIFVVFLYGIEKIYVFFLYPDEFGYWSSAATVLGWDWKEVAALGSYYSFGYSLCLLPALKLLPDAPITYRGAVVVNVLFMYLAFFLMIKIAEKLLPKTKKKTHILLAGLITLFPSWIFHMQFTATECLLFFLFVLLSYLMVLFLNKPSILSGVLLSVVSGYGFMVHMRFVGVVGAFVLTVVLWGILQSKNRKKLIVLGLALIGVCILAFFLKNIVRDVLYSGSGEEMLQRNEFGGQLGKIAYLFTFEGIRQLIINVSGKILYMGAASMGVFYYWILWCIDRIAKMIKRLKNNEEVGWECFLAVFLFLAVFAEIAIASVYSIKNADLDWIVYGRYSEFVLPVVMIVGMSWFYNRKVKVTVTLLAWCLHTVFSMVCLVSFIDAPRQSIRGYMSVGLSLLLKQDEVIPAIYLIGAWCLGTILIFAWSLCLHISRKNRAYTWVLALLMGAEIFLGLEASHKFIYPVNDYMGKELELGEYIMDEMPEADVLYLREDRVQWIDVIQMQLRERSIDVVEVGELPEKAAEGTVMIVHKDGALRAEAQKWYANCKEYNIFCLYYN